MSWLRRKIQGGKSGPGNYFGDGSDGHIKITSTGAMTSVDGVLWTTLQGWTTSSDTVFIPAVQDGDMVVVNALSVQIDAGITVTTLYRCRGVLWYSQGAVVNNGHVTMTNRGCAANPADAVVTTDTPVAPSDGNAVPEGGLVLARFADGTESGTSNLSGCGQAAVAAEANQPPVQQGKVIVIPRVGGAGGVGSTTHDATYGAAGGTKSNAPGGGGAGGRSGTSGDPGDTSGGDATPFASGPGGGGGYGVIQTGEGPTPGSNYGGAGGDADIEGNRGGGGAGHPPGGGLEDGLGGLAGLVIFIIGGDFDGTGSITSNGAGGGDGYGSSSPTAGGASGGGLIIIWYAGELGWTGTISVAGGVSNGTGGGTGGDGSIIGPDKIHAAA